MSIKEYIDPFEKNERKYNKKENKKGIGPLKW